MSRNARENQKKRIAFVEEYSAYLECPKCGACADDIENQFHSLDKISVIFEFQCQCCKHSWTVRYVKEEE